MSAGDTTAVFTNDQELGDSLGRAIANLRSTRDASPILNGDDLRIFVSYRWSDSKETTLRLCDRLKHELGSDRVFVDLDNVPIGDDFVEYIRARLKQCQVVLAVIGTEWRGRRRGAASRLDEVDDFVRMELSVALADSIRILPILIDAARMPAPADLPEDVRRLSTMNAATLRPEGLSSPRRRDIAAVRSSVGRGRGAPLLGRGGWRGHIRAWRRRGLQPLVPFKGRPIPVEELRLH